MNVISWAVDIWFACHIDNWIKLMTISTFACKFLVGADNFARKATRYQIPICIVSHLLKTIFVVESLCSGIWLECYLLQWNSKFSSAYTIISSACDKPLLTYNRKSINSTCSQPFSQVAVNWNGVGYIRDTLQIAMQRLCKTYYFQLCCKACCCCCCYQLETYSIGKCSYNATTRALNV